MAAQWPMMAISMLGFPAISVPTRVVDGLPVGVQLLGRRFREDIVFDAAEIIEARSGILTPITRAKKWFLDPRSESALSAGVEGEHHGVPRLHLADVLADPLHAPAPEHRR